MKPVSLNFYNKNMTLAVNICRNTNVFSNFMGNLFKEDKGFFTCGI